MGQAMIDAEELVLSGGNLNSIVDTLQLKVQAQKP